MEEFASRHLKRPNVGAWELKLNPIYAQVTTIANESQLEGNLSISWKTDFEASISRMGLNGLVTCVQGDLTTLDFSTATIVVIYLLPESVETIKSALIEAIRRGATLICNTWGPKGLQPVSRHLCGEFSTVTLLKYDVNSLCSAIDINK